jgi:hypothetical protein
MGQPALARCWIVARWTPNGLEAFVPADRKVALVVLTCLSTGENSANRGQPVALLDPKANNIFKIICS